MFTFRTFRIVSSVASSAAISPRGGWVWQVTKEVGPSELIVAQSGNGITYLTEDAAVGAYKEFVKWANEPPSSVPPPTE